MQDETNGQTSNQADCKQNSSEELHFASAELTPLDAASMCWVAGGPGGSIGVIGR